MVQSTKNMTVCPSDHSSRQGHTFAMKAHEEPATRLERRTETITHN